MPAIGTGVFAALAWGAIGLVVLVFAYELYVVAREIRAAPDGSQ